MLVNSCTTRVFVDENPSRWPFVAGGSIRSHSGGEGGWTSSRSGCSGVCRGGCGVGAAMSPPNACCSACSAEGTPFDEALEVSLSSGSLQDTFVFVTSSSMCSCPSVPSLVWSWALSVRAGLGGTTSGGAARRPRVAILGAARRLGDGGRELSPTDRSRSDAATRNELAGDLWFCMARGISGERWPKCSGVVVGSRGSAAAGNDRSTEYNKLSQAHVREGVSGVVGGLAVQARG